MCTSQAYTYILKLPHHITNIIYLYHILKLKHTSARTYLLSRSILGKVSRTFCGSSNAEAVVASIHCGVKDLLSFQVGLFIVCRIESNDRPHFLSFHALCPKTAQLAPGMTMYVAIFFLIFADRQLKQEISQSCHTENTLNGS